MNEDGKPDVERLEKRFTEEQMFFRYARARVRDFWLRQVATVLGSVVLGLVVSPMLGVVTAALALLGEAIDCSTLTWARRRLSAGASYSKLRYLTALSAAAQATSIAVCIWLAWTNLDPQYRAFFVLSFLAATMVNGGVSISHHPVAGKTRMAIYVLTLMGCVTSLLTVQAGDRNGLILTLASAGILFYTVVIFIGYARTSVARHRSLTHEILQQYRQTLELNEKIIEGQAKQKQLAAVAREANDSVMILDYKGNITWTNRTFTEITGYSSEDAWGKNIAELVNGADTDEDATRKLRSVATKGRPVRLEIVNYTKDGRKIWIDTNQVPIFDDAGRVSSVIAIERDITDAKLHEIELTEARQEAERAAQDKANFLATMSHEIRTPMNAIMGMSELLSSADLGKEEKLFAQTIYKAAKSLLKIINDILDLSKLEAGRLEISPVEFDPRECLSSTVELLRPLAHEKTLDLDLHMPPDLPGKLVGDDDRLRQILINLIGNALKFTHDGGIGVTADLQAVDDQTWLHIAVADTGIGIAPDRLDQIFEEFSQADRDIARTYGGTGLGLSISRLLALEMGGRIRVASDLGKGSTFSVELPFGSVRTATAETQKRSGAPVRVAPGLNILCADDNPANRLLVAKYLQELDVTLDFAVNGQEAVDKALANSPDLVLMDIRMPLLDGLTACRRIRSARNLQRRPRIIALSANTDSDCIADCMAAGMDGFLGKPTKKSALLAEITRVSDQLELRPSA